MTKTKTKTIIAVALTALSISSMVAGLYYYYGNRVRKGSPSPASFYLSISPSSLPVAVVNQSYSQTVALTAHNGAAPYKYECSGSGVAGITASLGGNACVLSGTPAATGTYTVTFKATDSAAPAPAAASQTLSFSVSTAASKISVTPASLSFGSVTVGSSGSAKTVSITNAGTADLKMETAAISGSAFSIKTDSCKNQTLKQNNACGIEVHFDPPNAGSYSGNLSIGSNAGDVNVPLSGTGSTSGGNIDLTITNSTSVKSPNNHDPFPVSVTVANQGSSSAGAFTVKGYFSVDEIPNNGGLPADYLLFTWNVPGLGAGASLSNSFSVSFSGFPIHNSYYVVVKVDADNTIAESNEENNIVSKMVYVSR